MTRLSLRGATALTCGAIALAALLKFDHEIALWVQFTLGKLAYSTSNGAALFLLLFCTVAAWRVQLGRREYAFALPTLWCALLLGNGVHGWLTVRYLQEMRIPLSQHIYHWSGESYSFTGLFHSHLGKTAFAVMAQAVEWQAAGYDSGGVFLTWVPHWAAWTLGVAFVLGCVACLLALPSLARRRHPAHVVLFVVAGALALRGMVDGGPLALGMPPILIALAWVSGAPRRAFWSVSALLLGAYAALWLSLTNALPALGGFLFPLGFMTWLGLVGRQRTFSVHLARLLLVGLLTAMLALDADDNLLTLVAPLPPHCQAVNFAQSQAVLWDCSGQTAWQVYRHFAEDPRKPHFTLIMATARGGVYQLPVGVLLVDTWAPELTLKPTPAWQQLAWVPATSAGGWLRIEAHASQQWAPVLAAGQSNAISRNNYNVYLWELARVLLRGGVSEFVLMPHTAGNSQRQGFTLLGDDDSLLGR